MKKVNLNNLYESPYPPTDIKILWVDRDESTGDIRAIHRYNVKTKTWEPYLVSVDYMQPTPPESETTQVISEEPKKEEVTNSKEE